MQLQTAVRINGAIIISAYGSTNLHPQTRRGTTMLVGCPHHVSAPSPAKGQGIDQMGHATFLAL